MYCWRLTATLALFISGLQSKVSHTCCTLEDHIAELAYILYSECFVKEFIFWYNTIYQLFRRPCLFNTWSSNVCMFCWKERCQSKHIPIYIKHSTFRNLLSLKSDIYGRKSGHVSSNFNHHDNGQF